MQQWIYICLVGAIPLLSELGVFLWWGSSLSTRVRQLESDKDRLYDEVENINSIRTEIAVIKATLTMQTSMLLEIKETLKGEK